MKTSTITLLAVLNLITLQLNAQTSLVGSGSGYSNIFSPNTSLTYDVPGTGAVSINLDSTGSVSSSPGVWDFTATGGANISVLGIGTESAAQVALASNSLQFNLSQAPGLGLLNALAGSSLHYGWEAQAYFDTSGVLNYQPNTMYNISFNVVGTGGLLGSVLGVTPQFTFELIDGSGNAVASNGNGSLVSIAGLLGGVSSGTVNLTYTTGALAPTGTMGVRFTGDTLVGANALGLGSTFATVSNLNITATPVPEPGSVALLGAVGIVVLLRRRRGLHA